MEKDLIEFNNKIMGKTFGKDLKFVSEAVKEIEADVPRLARFKNELDQGYVCGMMFLLCVFLNIICRSITVSAGGRDFKLTADMVSVKHTVIKQTSKL